MTKENWKNVPGFDGYQVSDMGRIRSFRSGGRIVEESHYLSTKSSRYVEVNVFRDGKRNHVRLAYLILLSFVGERPKGAVIRHLNDVKADNRLSNLVYGNQVENKQDQIRNGHGTGLQKYQVAMMRSEFSNGGITKTELSKRYGISLSGVSLILSNKRHIDKGLRLANQ